MLKLRLLIGSTLGALAAVGCLASSSNAATLNVVGGQLLGASNVLVDGNFYDVEFLDGTCIALFNGCDEASDFTFSSFAAATLASQALLDQVLLDGANLFDTSPDLTNGILTSVVGFLETPYTGNALAFSSLSTVNGDGASYLDTVAGPFTETATWNSSTNSSEAFARWSPVPEPGTASLVALGLAGIAAMRRRRTAALGCNGDRSAEPAAQIHEHIVAFNPPRAQLAKRRMYAPSALRGIFPVRPCS